MKKGIFIVSDINESRIESLDDLFNGAQVYVAYCKFASFFFIVEFNKRLVFEKGYTTSVLSGTNN